MGRAIFVIGLTLILIGLPAVHLVAAPPQNIAGVWKVSGKHSKLGSYTGDVSFRAVARGYYSLSAKVDFTSGKKGRWSGNGWIVGDRLKVILKLSGAGIADRILRPLASNESRATGTYTISQDGLVLSGSWASGDITAREVLRRPGGREEGSGSASGTASGTVKVYTVKAGDTLSKIARKHGLTLEKLLELNPKLRENPDLIRIGQKIVVGRGQAREVERTRETGTTREAETSRAERRTASRLSSICPGVDWSFISREEGGRETTAYVPMVSGNYRAGVTIATGFDIGQRSTREIRAMGFSPTLERKLLPYAELRGDDAKEAILENPLTITRAEAAEIDRIVKSKYLKSLIEAYDRASRVKYRDLPDEAQTVIASVSFQYGYLPTAAPNFWYQVTHQKWKDAKNNLLHFTKKTYKTGAHRGEMLYYLRRRREAALLDKIIS
jgi:hypothetical protein